MQFVVLFSCAILLVDGKFFLSKEHIEKVLESEEYVIAILELYYALDAPEENDNLNSYRKAIKEQNHDNYDELDKIMADIFLQVRVLKRMSIEWQRKREKLLKMKHYGTYADRMAKYLENYPTKKDFLAACEALFHYQELFGGNMKDLKMYNNFEGLSPNDYYDIGLQALKLNDLYHAAMWIEEGLKEADKNPSPKFLAKLIEIYNRTKIIDNYGRILTLYEKYHKITTKLDNSLHEVYRTATKNIKVVIKEEQEKCPKDDENPDSCHHYIETIYYNHETNVSKRPIYTTEAFKEYQVQCAHTSVVVHPSYCKITQLNPFHFLKQEVFHKDQAIKVIQYHDVYDRHQLQRLLDLGNSRTDFNKKKPEHKIKLRITKPTMVKNLLSKMAPLSKLPTAAIEVQLYTLGDLKFPRDADLIEGGRTQIVCFLNTSNKPNHLVLPYLGMQIRLEPGSCLSVHYGESTEARKVQHAICQIMDEHQWIMSITV